MMEPAGDLLLIGQHFIVAAVCGVSCALLGCYLVLRRLSLLGDAISHAVLPGLAIAFLLSGRINGWPIIAGAMIVGMLTAFLTQLIHQLGRVPEDASMGVVFTALFALGVLLISNLARHTDLDANCIFMGLIEVVPLDTVVIGGFEVPRALQTMLPMLALTIAFVLLLWKELKLVSFDPALASAMGIPACLLHYLLMAMVAGVTVTSFEAVGAILVVAMLVVPAATAHLLTDRLAAMLVWSAVVAVFAAFFGAVAAHWLNTSVAGMITVGAGLAFTVAVLLAPRHGILSKLVRNGKLALRIVSEDIIGLLYRREEGSPRSLPVAARQAGGSAWLGWLALAHLWWRRQIRIMADGTLELTDSGRRRAETIVRAHRLWEAYLEKTLELPLDHLHEPATHMEHFLDPDLQSELASQLGEPGVDPHGRAIPPAPSS